MSPRLWLGFTVDLAGLLIILGAYIIAVFIVIWTFKRAVYPDDGSHYKLKDCLGNAQWDFTNSWASNLTAVGALIGAALTAQQGALPQYSLFSLFLLLMAVLAPLAYNFIGKPESADATLTGQSSFDTTTLVQSLIHPNTIPEQKPYQYQGYIWGFLVACTLTLGAVIGEVIILIFLLGDLSTIKPMNATVGFIQLLLCLAVIAVGYYGWRTIPWTLQIQRSQQNARMEAHRHFIDRTLNLQGEALTRYVQNNPKPALPSWSLL